jgi:hypothetical protein
LAALPPEVVVAWRALGDRPLGHVDALLQRLLAEHGAAAVVEAIRESAATTHARDGKAHFNHVKALVSDKAQELRNQTLADEDGGQSCPRCNVRYQGWHDCWIYQRSLFREKGEEGRKCVNEVIEEAFQPPSRPAWTLPWERVSV